MPRIELQTEIKAHRSIVFDLSRSIDLHKISIKHTKEEAVSGKTSGLITLDESVTWKAKHFGITQLLTSKITEFSKPDYFVDEMVQGAFKEFKHEHYFREIKNGTLMIDIFEYRSPLGIIGEIVDRLFLKRYLVALLTKRNSVIKNYAESGKWQQILYVG